MSLQITFDPDISELSNVRVIIKAEDALVRSYPMNVEDHYRDLTVVGHFLSKRILSSIPLGDEAMAEVRFLSENDFVELRPYRRLDGSNVSGKFVLTQGLKEINKAINRIAAILPADRTLLDKQVADDINSGVYLCFIQH